MSVAERMAPISASDGSPPAERICSMVTMGQAKHSRPSHSVDQAQISVSVVPRHHKNAAAAIETPAALCGDSPFQASHAPTATTRLPKAALRYRVQDGITIGVLVVRCCQVISGYARSPLLHGALDEECSCLSPTGNMELLEHIGQVIFDGLVAQFERRGNLFVGQAVGH